MFDTVDLPVAIDPVKPIKSIFTRSRMSTDLSCDDRYTDATTGLIKSAQSLRFLTPVAYTWKIDVELDLRLVHPRYKAIPDHPPMMQGCGALQLPAGCRGPGV